LQQKLVEKDNMFIQYQSSCYSNKVPIFRTNSTMDSTTCFIYLCFTLHMLTKQWNRKFETVSYEHSLKATN